MLSRGFSLSLRAIRRQLTAMPCGRYLVRWMHHHTRKPYPGERLWSASQILVESTVRFLRARNREGFDIYFRPYALSHNAGYILGIWTAPRPPSWMSWRPRPCTVRRDRDQPRPPAGLDSGECATAATGAGNRNRKTTGPLVPGRPGQRRLAPSGKAGRIHPSKNPAARAQWIPSLGEGLACHRGPGAAPRCPGGGCIPPRAARRYGPPSASTAGSAMR